MSGPRPIVILGNTAGGKSELAVALAERLPGGGEVVSADSMQVYRHMDAGTAKPTLRQRERAAHHLIDIALPTEPFTAADWLERAEAAIADIQSRGRRPIIVGGTNLYLNALLLGMDEAPPRDPSFRASLEAIEPAELHRRLQAVDPAAAKRIAPADRQRLTRALEVHHVTGQPLSALQQAWQRGPDAAYRHDPVLIGLNWPTDAINRRINLRVKAMFHPEKVDPQLAADVCLGGESLPDETSRLDAAGLLGEQARAALGYKQVLAVLHRSNPAFADARIRTMAEAMEWTKILTRRFGKQQRTWMRRYRGVHWLEAAERSGDELANEAVALVAESVTR